MTNAKITKRALLSSVLSLILCVSMLVGTTFAWFTDSVTSANNVIKSGNLDIELEYWNGTKWVDVNGQSDILTNELWEPGVTEVAYFRIANAGSLALKYQFGINIVSETAGKNVAGEELLLSDYIQFGVVEGVNGETGAYATREEAVAAVDANAKIISDGYTKDATMVKDEELYLALVVYMPENVGNAANHNGTDIPQIDLGINIIATQVVNESDSFGNDYDTGATYPQSANGTFAGGETIKTDDVSVKLDNAAEEAFYELNVDNKMESTNADGQTTLSLNIDLLKNGVKIPAASGVSYAVEIYVGKNLEIVSVKHKGEAVSNFDYDINNGKVSFETDSFSPFEVVYKTLVAKVGTTVYYTIDEAIANWKHNTTLTLMNDVTLSSAIQLSSTEYHVLDLGTYTMTAASTKDAIQIVNNGRSSASYTLDIKADANNPGGIIAKSKAIVKTTGKSGVKDRPIIRFYNGVFTADNIVSHSGSNGTNCPQFQFHGGVYNGNMSANRALFQFFGGTFNGRFYISVDSSAYALISGGRFKYLDNLYGSALNSDKFTIGSSKGNFDRGVYVDKDGYIVVGGPVITESTGYAAVATNVSKAGSYLPYSSAATYGLYYEDAAMAIQKHGEANVTVFGD